MICSSKFYCIMLCVWQMLVVSPTECFLSYLTIPEDDSTPVDLRQSAVVIMSHLDRLCTPYLPPTASHKVEQDVLFFNLAAVLDTLKCFVNCLYKNRFSVLACPSVICDLPWQIESWCTLIIFFFFVLWTKIVMKRLNYQFWWNLILQTAISKVWRGFGQTGREQDWCRNGVDKSPNFAYKISILLACAAQNRASDRCRIWQFVSLVLSAQSRRSFHHSKQLNTYFQKSWIIDFAKSTKGFRSSCRVTFIVCICHCFFISWGEKEFHCVCILCITYIYHVQSYLQGLSSAYLKVLEKSVSVPPISCFFVFFLFCSV